MNSMNREMAISPVFLPGKFYEQRGLSARTRARTHTHTHTHTHRIRENKQKMNKRKSNHEIK